MEKNGKVAKTLCLANDEYFTGQFVRFLNKKRGTKKIELVGAAWRTEVLYYRKERSYIFTGKLPKHSPMVAWPSVLLSYWNFLQWYVGLKYNFTSSLIPPP